MTTELGTTVEADIANDVSVSPLAAATHMDCEQKESTEEVKEIDTTPIHMSKKAQKRLRRQEAYDAARPERQRKNKEKKAAKRLALRTAIASGEIQRPATAQRIVRVPSQLRVLVDCSFDDFMTDREIKSMCSQLTRCYSENRNAKHPCTLMISGWNNKIADRFRTVFKDQQKGWSGVAFFDTEYMTEDGTVISDIAKEDLIYLSADSDDVVEEIDESKVYIIGGIVDKNRHKNICNDKAHKQGLKTARLPIEKYIDMASRKVLTVNHVFEIMSRWLEHRDWEKAFLDVIPKRKIPLALKNDESREHAEQNDQDDYDAQDEQDEQAEQEEQNLGEEVQMTDAQEQSEITSSLKQVADTPGHNETEVDSALLEVA